MNQQDGDIEKEIRDLSETRGIFSRKEWKTLRSNFQAFIKFIVEILGEKPEAESYPIYFLPSLWCILLFVITMEIGVWGIASIFMVDSVIKQILFSLCTPIVFVLGFMLGLKIAVIVFQGSHAYQDLCILTAIFSVPLSLGFFFFWFFSYIHILFAIPILFFSHSISIVSLYIALPKILLLKGYSRFTAVILSIGMSIFATLIFFRIILPI